jgi:hypothetical protein
MRTAGPSQSQLSGRINNQAARYTCAVIIAIAIRRRRAVSSISTLAHNYSSHIEKNKSK